MEKQIRMKINLPHMRMQRCNHDRTGEEKVNNLEVNRCIRTETRETVYMLHYAG